MMSIIRALFSMVLLAAVFSGCAWDVYELGEPPKSTADFPAKALIAVSSAIETAMAKDAKSCAVPIDASAVRQIVAEPLAKMGVFRKAELIEGNASADAASVCSERGADFLVNIRVTDHKVEYKGRNGWYLWSLGVWFLCWVGSYWVPDETFDASMTVNVELLDGTTGKAVWEKSFSATATRSFNDFQRGWSLFAMFDDGFDETNFSDAAAHLDRRIWPDLRPKIFEAVMNEVPPAIRKARWKPARAKRAIVAGLGPEPYRKDAQGVAEFLTSKAGFDKSDIVLVTGDLEKGSAVVDALKNWKELDFPERDFAFFYFAGSGSVGDDGLPALAAGGNRWVSLADLAASLNRFKAAAAVIDAGFSQAGGARSIKRGAKPSAEKFKNLLNGSKATLVMSAGPGKEGLEDSAGGKGTLTRVLFRGLAGAADLDKSGVLGLEEVEKYTVSQFKGMARVLSKQAEPVFSFSPATWFPSVPYPEEKEPVEEEPAVPSGSGDKPADGSGEKPADGAGEKPADGTGAKPADGAGEEPADGTGTKPADSAGEKPADGTGAKPADGAGEKPADGTGAKPADGAGEKPADGTGAKPADGTDEKPADGAGEKPADGTGAKPADGTGEKPAGG